ncbi:hypothetical protein E4N95_13355 [Treponema denticola]|uniref:hypothetical protein n=1 Tax=Treponema denticola TaxID=158 RepID=UPI003D90E9FE
MNEINFTQDYIVYSIKKEGVYPLPESDWERLKNLIKKIIPETKLFNVIASVAFGIFISSIFSLITFYSVQNLNKWIIPTNWAILIASLVIGFALVIIDNQQGKIIKLSTTIIIEEMQEIEKKFVKEVND